MGRAHASTFFFSFDSILGTQGDEKKRFKRDKPDRQIRHERERQKKAQRPPAVDSVCGPWGLRCSFLMYLLSQPTEKEAGQLYISLLDYSADEMVAPLSRARPLLASVGCPDEWPSNSKGPGKSLFLFSFWLLFYDGWRMTRRGVRGDNSFT